MYGMDKTTVYLPADLKARVTAVARRKKIAEAEVIRDAIRAAVEPARPSPTPALFAAEAFADRVDDLLPGFGER